MHVIEGMADGRVGLIAKVHHSVIDGVAGAEMLAKLLDLTPEGSAVTEPCPPWVPARLPSQTRLVTDALPSFLRSPLRGLRAAARGRPHGGAPGPLRGGRPPRPGVDPAGRARHVRVTGGRRPGGAFAELDMAKVRALKTRFGSTINDVVLAVCSGALRTHLAAHGQDVESPLVAVVPVSVRGDERRRGAGQPPLGHVRAAVERQEDAAGAPAHGDRGERARARARSAPSATAPWRPC